MLDKKDKAKRNSNDVKLHRNKRKERIESGNPELWNIKDCAAILSTDYLRAKYGFMAWQKCHFQRTMRQYELGSMT
ncbi:hypothetical protein QLH32_18395 (plasmid) [Acinetobacter corruptisaponis]|uniref:Uncharacterized protein n=1 Tax=Acinetobacter corruptisaponis TaxID=3045147 RepID=A0ABY8SB55_9GAMM|nr:hypothetical protein [Acinetobacter sp. KCTC 92772]WHP07747.1 hypothetical protein QLH32_18395 [Acinetobacter sp. KCTC 92772]